LERRVKTLVKGFPIEQMAPYISKQNEQNSTFHRAYVRVERSTGGVCSG
jgi:hypothetical protein